MRRALLRGVDLLEMVVVLVGLVQGIPTDGIAREVMAATPDCAVLDDEDPAACHSSSGFPALPTISIKFSFLAQLRVRGSVLSEIGEENRARSSTKALWSTCFSLSPVFFLLFVRAGWFDFFPSLSLVGVYMYMIGDMVFLEEFFFWTDLGVGARC